MDGDNLVKGGGTSIGMGVFLLALYFIFGSQITLLIGAGGAMIVFGIFAVVLGVWINNN